MTKPRISIITPVWGGDVMYLWRAYTSLLAQDEQGWEWVIGQDATDAAEREFAEVDSRIRFANTHARQGPAGGRNAAAAASSAPFLVNLDADDQFADPGVLTRIVAALDTGEVQYAVSPATDVLPSGERVTPPLYREPGRIARGELVRRWRKVNVEGIGREEGVSIHPTTVALTADAFFAVGGYPALTVGEDTAFLLRLNRDFDGALLDTASHLYIKRDDSMMTSDDYAAARDERAALLARFFPAA